MHLTRESEYALLGLAFLARSPADRVTSLADIAAAQDLPTTFLAKIFQKLARHGLLTSERGRGRGYALARPAGEITVREVLEAVEGPRLFDRCLLWTGHCGDQDPCPLHYRLKELRPALESLLASVTLAEYVEKSPHAGGTKGRLVRGTRPSAPPRRRGKSAAATQRRGAPGAGRLRVIPLLMGLLAAGAVGAAGAAGAAGAGGAASSTQTPEQGRRIFEQKCVACHATGAATSLGPDLTGVTARRDRLWLARWVAAPDRMLAAGDSLATALLEQFNNIPMPNMGLSEGEVSAVIAYLDAQSAAAPPATSGPPLAEGVAAAPAPEGGAPAGVAGDARAGKDLFTGARRLSNGGPSCMACHSIGGIGALGGGALGPELTGAYAKFGDEGLAAVLAGLPFPTMSPIYGTRPLTSGEQADLLAYFREAATLKRPVGATGRLALVGVTGMLLFLALVHLTWRGRLRAVRGALVREAR